jgi:hypothetical protein
MKITLMVLLLTGLFLGGCGTVNKNSDGMDKLTQNIVEKTGKLETKSGDDFVLSTGDGLINITSTKVELDDFMKKKIKVKGMFSGSTLYVDEVENQE